MSDSETLEVYAGFFGKLKDAVEGLKICPDEANSTKKREAENSGLRIKIRINPKADQKENEQENERFQRLGLGLRRRASQASVAADAPAKGKGWRRGSIETVGVAGKGRGKPAAPAKGKGWRRGSIETVGVAGKGAGRATPAAPAAAALSDLESGGAPGGPTAPGAAASAAAGAGASAAAGAGAGAVSRTLSEPVAAREGERTATASAAAGAGAGAVSRTLSEPVAAREGERTATSDIDDETARAIAMRQGAWGALAPEDTEIRPTEPDDDGGDTTGTGDRLYAAPGNVPQARAGGQEGDSVEPIALSLEDRERAAIAYPINPELDEEGGEDMPPGLSKIKQAAWKKKHETAAGAAAEVDDAQAATPPGLSKIHQAAWKKKHKDGDSAAGAAAEAAAGAAAEANYMMGIGPPPFNPGEGPEGSRGGIFGGYRRKRITYKKSRRKKSRRKKSRTIKRKRK
jgi:hypothetical protein